MSDLGAHRQRLRCNGGELILDGVACVIDARHRSREELGIFEVERHDARHVLTVGVEDVDEIEDFVLSVGAVEDGTDSCLLEEVFHRRGAAKREGGAKRGE